jgi:hypothetical protein
MAVKRDIFVSYMERNGLDTGRLMALYNFTGSSGVLVYNNVHSTGDHHYSEDGSRIVADVIPGISMGQSDSLETSTAGVSGFADIDGDCIMQLGTGITFEDWTVFFSVKQLEEQATKYDLQRVLLSSSKNGTGVSGFSFGIANNRAYYQFPDGDGLNPAVSENDNKISTTTNPRELSERSVISLSRMAIAGTDAGNVHKQIQLSVHDFINETKTISLYGPNDRHSNDWFFGNFYENISDATLPFWDGFSGYVEDMVLVSGFVSPDARHDLSKTFCATGYQKEGAQLQEVEFTKITGHSFIDYSAVTGTGVTGYSFEKVSDVSTLDDDNTPSTISLYSNVALTGEITGEKRKYLTGEATGSTVEYLTLPEHTFFDPELISGYGKDNVVPNIFRDGSDTIEVYSYLATGVYEEGASLSLTPKRIAREPHDIYKLDVDYTGENVNVYRNGALQNLASQQLVAEDAMVNYINQNNFVTGFYELGPEYGIKAGQTYHVDFTYDYTPYAPGVVSGQVGSQNVFVGMGVLTGTSGNAVEEWNRLSEDLFDNGTNGEGGMIAVSGEVMARTDTLLLVHKPGGSERLPGWVYTGDGTGPANLSTIVKLDHVGDYVIQNSGDLQSSGVFGSSDDIMYDKIPGDNKHFLWTGQSDNHEGVNREEVAGTGASGIIYFNDYFLGYEPYSVIGNASQIETDIYFNGQKMMSGVNYTIDHVKDDNLSGYAIKMDADTINDATGVFQFVPTVSGMGLFNKGTGVFEDGASSFQTSFTLMEEQVWINGVRQKFGETEDYVKASEFSKLSKGKRLKPKTTLAYSTNAGVAGTVGIELT